MEDVVNKIMKENPLERKSFEFALSIISVCNELRRNNEFVLSHQLLKSGTSIGANVSEAQGSQSKKDFRAKMSIAYKEAKEAHYWLRLMRESDVYHLDNIVLLESNLIEILKMLNAIMRSTREP